MTGAQFIAVCRALIGRTLPEPADDEAWFLEAKRELLDKLHAVEPPPPDELFELVMKVADSTTTKDELMKAMPGMIRPRS